MGAVTDAVMAQLTPSEISELGSVRIDGAVSDALLKYSGDFPLELAELCDVSLGGVVTLPVGWVDGWSDVSAFGYPVMTGGVAGDDGIAIYFDVADWVLDAGRYYIELNHGLESENVLTQFSSGDTQIGVDSISVISVNKIRAYVLASPDGRFQGKALIERA